MFVIDDYYKLLALHKLIMLTKFDSRPPIDPTLLASPFIAQIIEEIRDTLAEMERNEGISDGNRWKKQSIASDSKTWNIALKHATNLYGERWHNLTHDQHKQIPEIYLSPYAVTDELKKLFHDQIVNAISNADEE